MTLSSGQTMAASCVSAGRLASGSRPLFMALATGLVALGGCAATPAARDAAPAAPTTAPTEVGAFETTRSAVRSSTEWLARGVDKLFGDKPFEQGGSVREGQLALSLLHRQDTGTDIDVRLKARFRLPNLEAQSGYLFVGRDDPREVVKDTPAAVSRQQRQLPARDGDLSFFAGLGFALRESVDVRLGVRGGLKPYVQARYRRPWVLGERDLLEFRQTLFWSVDDHLGSTTALAYEHAYSPTLALRWLNAATITQESRKFDWSSNLGAYKLLPEQRVFSLALLAGGRQGAGVAVTDVGMQARWQQPVHRDWLLGDVTLGHFWPRPDAQSPRGRAWAVGTGLQLLF